MTNKTLISIALAATLAYWLVLILKIPLFDTLPGWFWPLKTKPLGLIWLIAPVILLSYSTLTFILKNPARRKLNLMLLILLGYFVQMSFGFMENRGIDGIRDRLVTTGHAQFAEIAAQETGILQVAAGYEDLLAEGRLGDYARSKPPGTLLFYMMTQKLSNAFSPVDSPIERQARLITFAAYVYPLISYLVIFPLYYLCRIFIPHKQAIIPCILYLFIPNVTLVTLHLDQVLYPFLFTLCLHSIMYSCHKESIRLAFVSGIIIFISVYVSFSMLYVVPLSAMFALAGLMRHRSDTINRSGYLFVLLGIMAGLAAMLIAFRLALNYDILTRFNNAVAYHQAWKPVERGIGITAYIAFLNYLEFACWVGLPLAVLYLAHAGRTVGNIFKKRSGLFDLFGAAAIFTLIHLGFFSKTIAEVARLWIFFVPIICMLAGYEITTRFGSRAERTVKYLVFCQLATITVIKRCQDFW